MSRAAAPDSRAKNLFSPGGWTGHKNRTRVDFLLRRHYYFPVMKKNRTFLSGHAVRLIVLGAVFFALSFSSDAGAEDPAEKAAQGGLFPSSSWTGEKTYLDKSAHKFGFGFLNISTGWTALFFESVRGKYFFDGVVKGLFYTLTNTAGGVLHAATFPVPVDVPLLHGGIAHEYSR